MDANGRNRKEYDIAQKETKETKDRGIGDFATRRRAAGAPFLRRAWERVVQGRAFSGAVGESRIGVSAQEFGRSGGWVNIRSGWGIRRCTFW
jgi:hypothetical protein